VPLRSVIGLSDQYGATIQVDLKKIPKLWYFLSFANIY
jgi:hypothetical protein